MSLILDALKKSEQERRRGRGPDLQSLHQPAMPVPAQRGWLPWAALGLVLVGINGAALAWWLSRPDGAAPAVTPRGAEVAVAAVQPATPSPQPEAPAATAAPAAA